MLYWAFFSCLESKLVTERIEPELKVQAEFLNPASCRCFHTSGTVWWSTSAPIGWFQDLSCRSVFLLIFLFHSLHLFEIVSLQYTCCRSMHFYPVWDQQSCLFFVLFFLCATFSGESSWNWQNNLQPWELHRNSVAKQYIVYHWNFRNIFLRHWYWFSWHFWLVFNCLPVYFLLLPKIEQTNFGCVSVRSRRARYLTDWSCLKYSWRNSAPLANQTGCSWSFGMFLDCVTAAQLTSPSYCWPTPPIL